MSVWSMLLACQGFIYDGPAGAIGFRPVYRPEDHRSFFTAAEGFGLFSQKRAENTQASLVEIRSGLLKLSTLVLALPSEAKNPHITLHDGQHETPFTVERREDRIMLRLKAPIILHAGQTLTAEFDWSTP
jgi:hypothetical protein